MSSNHLPPDRIVSYIDILGFKDKIKKMEDDAELYKVIKYELTRLDQDVIKPNNEQFKDKYNAVLLSDSIVVSSPRDGDEGRAEQFIIFATHSLALYLMSRNIIVRGGISRGWCHHEGNVIFGKGFLNAYNLGEKVAIVPRIIVDDVIVNSLHPTFNDVKEHHLICDSDGFWFINIFKRPYITKPSQPLSDWELDGLRAHIISGLNESKNDSPNIKAKYRWLANQYNQSAECNKINLLDYIL